MDTLTSEIPRFFILAVKRRDINLLALTLDATIPPLSLLWLMILFFLTVSCGFLANGNRFGGLLDQSRDFRGVRVYGGKLLVQSGSRYFASSINSFYRRRRIWKNSFVFTNFFWSWSEMDSNRPTQSVIIS